MNSHAVLHTALPEKFPFYHLGTVELAGERTLPGEELQAALEGHALLGFAFSGDQQAVLLLAIPATENAAAASMYEELGNVLGSRAAGRIAAGMGRDVLVSPPRRLDLAQALGLAAGVPRISVKSYFHVHQEKTVALQALLLPAATERTGNA